MSEKKLIHAEDTESSSHSRWLYVRIALLILGVILLFGVVMHRMYSLQVEETDLDEKARAQVSGKVTLGAGGEAHLDGHRGYIYDRDGFELAISVEVPSLYAHPRQIEDKPQAASQLADILPMSEDQILEKLEKDVSFVWLSRKIKPSEGDAIRKLELKGVGLKRESKRYYPAQDVAGQIIGFSGTDNVGLAGLEAAYDDELRGGVIELEGLRDARGQLLLTLETPRLNYLEGSSVVLTIDQHIQRLTEVAIERAAREYDAKAAYGIVLDPNTGEILALANWPTFNPNRFSDYTLEEMRNNAVLDVFEPGSVTKPLVYAAGLDEGVIKPNTPLDGHDGALSFGEDLVVNDTHVVKDLDAEMMVIESSNIGAYQVAKRIGKDDFYQYLRAFGFGEKTGVGIAGESAGLLWPSERWYEIDLANIAFGQGLGVSPLQLAMAISVLANDGTLMKPMLIKEVRDQDGNIIEQAEPEVRRDGIISPEAAAMTRVAMEKVVTQGTGLRAWVDGYRVGGKTGTPQKVDPKRKKYVNRWMANFVGIAPIDDPDIVVVIMIDEPTVSHLGGRVAAPAFAEIVSKTLPYRGVHPSEVYTGEAVKFPTMVRGQTQSPDVTANEDGQTGESQTGESLSGNQVAEAGTGGSYGSHGQPTGADAASGGDPAVSQMSAALATASSQPNDLIWDDRYGDPDAENKVKVPDFSGMTLRDALQTASGASLVVKPDNTGFVVDQWPAPGTSVEANTPVELTLARRYRQQHLGFIR